MLGIKDSFVPFPPFMNVPILVALNEVAKRPIVKNDKIEIAPVMYANVTLDHRYIDGASGRKI